MSVIKFNRSINHVEIEYVNVTLRYKSHIHLNAQLTQFLTFSYLQFAFISHKILRKMCSFIEYSNKYLEVI